MGLLPKLEGYVATGWPATWRTAVNDLYGRRADSRLGSAATALFATIESDLRRAEAPAEEFKALAEERRAFYSAFWRASVLGW